MVWPWQVLKSRPALVHGMAFATPLVLLFAHRCHHLRFKLCPFSRAVSQIATALFVHSGSIACRRAKRVITISESTRQDVHRFFDIPLDRIDVVFPGVDDVYKPQLKTAVSRFKSEKGLNGRMILHVGTLQPRKNIPTLLDAFAKLDEPDLKLLLVGGKGWLF